MKYFGQERENADESTLKLTTLIPRIYKLYFKKYMNSYR